MRKLKLLLTSTLICVALPGLTLTAAWGAETVTSNNKRLKSTVTTAPETALATAEKPSRTKSSQPVVEDLRIDSYESSYYVNHDYTYTQIISEHDIMLTSRGVEQGQRATYDYYPDSQSLQLIEAYVIQPDGQKLAVAPENIFTRSSQESQDAPGFSSSLTTTVVFPKLVVGSQTFVKWKLVQKKPPVVGFSVLDSPSFEYPTVKETVKIALPASLKLQWKKRGDYVVTDEIQSERRIVTAMFKKQSGHQSGNHLVSSGDVSPVFVASSLSSWEEIGEISWRLFHDKVLVTPEIKALANQITGKKAGIEAAQAIYNWSAKNVHYIAVYQDEAAGYVPHTSVEVLHHGYGDCKDHVVLMQALLKAKGINSYPVLVNWGESVQQLPLWTSEQFNHVMIYLPAYNIFANPTDEYASFGELDTELTGRFVVMATEKSYVAYTPQAVADKNRYSLTSVVTISPDGTVEGQNELKFSGNFNNSIRSDFASDTPEHIVNQLLAQTPEGGTGTLKISDGDNLNQPMTARGRWSSSAAVNMGKQAYFSTPVGIDPRNPYLFRDYITSGKHLSPMIVGASDFNWKYKILIPAGYKISHIPENSYFLNVGGKYTSSYEIGNGYILIKRHLLINKDVYSSQDYSSFKVIIYQIIKDAHSVMVLEKI